jgi:hypothetical protein
MPPDATLEPRPPVAADAHTPDARSGLRIRKFRQIVLWPVQLMPRHEGAQIQRHWEHLAALDAATVWKEVADEFTGNPAEFSERHYKEFVTFLPYVQRFLHAEGGRREGRSGFGDFSIRVFRRHDVAQVR